MLSQLQKIGRLPIWKVVLGLFMAVILAGSVSQCAQEHAARNAAEKRAEQLIIVNDSTQARLTQVTTERNELRALKDASRTLGGSLVAGVKLRVRPDTILVPVRVAETVTLGDSTRLATLRDSTAGYQVTVTGRAPPTGPLELGYQIVTPEFNPEVGFVKRGEDYYAVVSWAGKRIETSEAFFRPERPRPLSLWSGVSASAVPTANIAGATVRANVFMALQYRLNPRTDVALRASYAGQPAVGIQVSRKLF